MIRGGLWFYMYGGVRDHAQGLAVCFPVEVQDLSQSLLAKIDEALLLVRDHDRPAYEEMLHSFQSINVVENRSVAASWCEVTNSCWLCPQYARDASAAALAGTLVHEATHAKLMRGGVGYGQGVRARVEAICHRRSLSFLRRLPGSTATEQTDVVRTMEYYESRYSDREWAERKLARARQSGIPRRIARLLLPSALRRASGNRRSIAVHPHPELTP